MHGVLHDLLHSCIKIKFINGTINKGVSWIYIQMGVELKLEGFKHLSTVQKMLDLHAITCQIIMSTCQKKKSQLIA